MDNKDMEVPDNLVETSSHTPKAHRRTSKVFDLDEINCKCMKIVGYQNLPNIDPRIYHAQPGHLGLNAWCQNPYIWLHYVESTDGTLHDDDVLLRTDTRYWNIHDVQRYFSAQRHCTEVLYTYQYPNLRMPTPYGDYLWRFNTATKLPKNLFVKTLNQDIISSVTKIKGGEAKISRLIVPDQLLHLDRFDYFGRRKFFENLLHVLSLQEHLQLVSFENMRCKRLEGVRLIQQLACFNSQSLKYLFLWDFFLPNESPLLINYSYITGTGLYIPRPKTKQCFIRSLAELRNLRVLALEYSYLADGTGAALLALLPVLKKPHFRLQLVCRETHIPGKTDAALGAGGYGISDTAWRQVLYACPDLYLLMAFFKIRDYDNIRRFLTPSMCLREVHLQLGIDLKMRQRQDSDISCFVRHIAYRYGDTLTTLSIHQWRFAVFPLRRVFELMPHLVRFFYVGRVQDDVDLKRLLEIVASGVCDKLKQLRIQIQDDESKRPYWKNVVDFLNQEYFDIMHLFDINLCINVYKS